jgi:hypothetical protein
MGLLANDLTLTRAGSSVKPSGFRGGRGEGVDRSFTCRHWFCIFLEIISCRRSPDGLATLRTQRTLGGRMAVLGNHISEATPLGESRFGPHAGRLTATGRAGCLARPPARPSLTLRALAPFEPRALPSQLARSDRPRSPWERWSTERRFVLAGFFHFPRLSHLTPFPRTTCEPISSYTSPFHAVKAKIVNSIRPCCPMLMRTRPGGGLNWP